MRKNRILNSSVVIYVKYTMKINRGHTFSARLGPIHQILMKDSNDFVPCDSGQKGLFIYGTEHKNNINNLEFYSYSAYQFYCVEREIGDQHFNALSIGCRRL